VAGRVYAVSADGFSLPAIVKGFLGNLKDLFTPKTLVSEPKVYEACSGLFDCVSSGLPLMQRSWG
jgi:hypothetical protein